MAKDIKWLKREIHKELEDWHGVEGGIDGDGINEIMLLINQHEESEVKRLERKMKELDDAKFQFIQWEDEKPYNIQALVDEYEKEYQIKNAKIVNVDASKISGNASDYKHFYKRLGESEETEVKKDIEWLREQIKNEMNGWSGGNPDYFRGAEDAYEDVKDWLNQLDEPEVLSWEWIDEYAVVGQYPDGMGHVVPAYKLQNLLVPKQEEVDQAYKDGYEQGKEHATEKQTEETETVASVLVDYLIASAKLKLALSTEVEELEE